MKRLFLFMFLVLILQGLFLMAQQYPCVGCYTCPYFEQAQLEYCADYYNFLVTYRNHLVERNQPNFNQQRFDSVLRDAGVYANYIDILNEKILTFNCQGPPAPIPCVTDPGEVTDSRTTLVVHQTMAWPNRATFNTSAIDSILLENGLEHAYFEPNHIFISLDGQKEYFRWSTTARNPGAVLESNEPVELIDFQGETITIVGGNFEDSLKKSLRKVIVNHSPEKPVPTLTIKLPMAAIYNQHGGVTLQDIYEHASHTEFYDWVLDEYVYFLEQVVDPEVKIQFEDKYGVFGYANPTPSPEKLVIIKLESQDEERDITITSPSGGETFSPGDTVNINWNSSGEINQVHIYLHSYGTWCEDIARYASNTGHYQWTVPSHLQHHCQYTIEVRSVDSPIVWDISNEFCIEDNEPRSITITSPPCGVIYRPGDQMNVTWTSTGNINQVHIYLHSYGIWCVDIARYAPNTGYYVWTVPSYLQSHCHYTVEVRSADSPIVWDISCEFCITNTVAKPDLTIPEMGIGWNGVVAVVQNIGDAPTPDNIPITVVLYDEDGLVGEKTLKSLGPGGAEKVQFPIEPPFADAYTAVVDHNNLIDESNEANNSKTIEIK